MMVTNETNSAAIRQTGDTGEKEVFKLKDLKDVNDDEKIFRNMYIKGLFGGLYTIGDNEPTNNDGRNKGYSANTFSVGDIVVLYDDDFETDTYVAGEKNMYLYLGDNTFATVLDEELILINEDNGAKLVDSLLGQNCFVVLRPSYSFDVSDIQETEKPEGETEPTDKNETNISNSNEDKSIADKKLPKAGFIKNAEIAILVITIAGIFFYVKYKRSI